MERAGSANRIVRPGLTIIISSIAIALSLPGIAPSLATASTRSCGKLRGANVEVLRGRVKCFTARRVLKYALNHHWGNGPGSPKRWQCFRIAGDRHWTGIECVSPPNSGENPDKWIAARERY